MPTSYRNPTVRDEYLGYTATQYLATATVAQVASGAFMIFVDHPDGAFYTAPIYLNTWGASEIGELALVLELEGYAPAPTPPVVSLRTTAADRARWQELKRERALAFARDAGLRPADLITNVAAGL